MAKDDFNVVHECLWAVTSWLPDEMKGPLLNALTKLPEKGSYMYSHVVNNVEDEMIADIQTAAKTIIDDIVSNNEDDHA